MAWLNSWMLMVPPQNSAPKLVHCLELVHVHPAAPLVKAQAVLRQHHINLLRRPVEQVRKLAQHPVPDAWLEVVHRHEVIQVHLLTLVIEAPVDIVHPVNQHLVALHVLQGRVQLGGQLAVPSHDLLA